MDIPLSTVRRLGRPGNAVARQPDKADMCQGSSRLARILFSIEAYRKKHVLTLSFIEGSRFQIDRGRPFFLRAGLSSRLDLAKSCLSCRTLSGIGRDDQDGMLG
ncbi:hypothetical protein MKK65_01180 [Methylobacterium sp. J-001]|uniref:hypothetical protein n=1 Tax=Methylobacterium sp. J-001 TaxID=2836609 RepID=UPI001FBA02C2|nr:hypothetical protein [Methylobacterium sp. J-001]MCJ2115220.1 hypothetical protein [Methylobacterium sp. J-001]